MSHHSRSELLGAPSNGETKPSAHSSWLRLFIAVSLTTMVLRSGLNTVMHHLDWSSELEMFTLPYPLPDARERADIRAGGSRYATLTERTASSAASVLRFFAPSPSAKTAPHLTSATAWLKYGVVWVHTRLEFLGRLIGVDERWTMFSPSVGTRRVAVRAHLHFADGSMTEVRTRVEPDDFTDFVRPFAQRRLQLAINIAELDDVRTSWCQALIRAHPTNESGATLVVIDLHKVRHDLPPPDVDPVAHWSAENHRRAESAPFWRCDVTRGTSEAMATIPSSEDDGAN